VIQRRDEDGSDDMLTRAQQLGLLFLVLAFIVYVAARVR
jgi:hypothetical protein